MRPVRSLSLLYLGQQISPVMGFPDGVWEKDELLKRYTCPPYWAPAPVPWL